MISSSKLSSGSMILLKIYFGFDKDFTKYFKKIVGNVMINISPSKKFFNIFPFSFVFKDFALHSSTHFFPCIQRLVLV